MRFIPVIVVLLLLSACGGKGINKILKSPDPEYKLRMAEKYFVDKKYLKAQVLFEDVMPYYKANNLSEGLYERRKSL